MFNRDSQLADSTLTLGVAHTKCSTWGMVKLYQPPPPPYWRVGSPNLMDHKVARGWWSKVRHRGESRVVLH